jgi:hypothetical protein
VKGISVKGAWEGHGEVQEWAEDHDEEEWTEGAYEDEDGLWKVCPPQPWWATTSLGLRLGYATRKGKGGDFKPWPEGRSSHWGSKGFGKAGNKGKAKGFGNATLGKIDEMIKAFGKAKGFGKAMTPLARASFFVARAKRQEKGKGKGQLALRNKGWGKHGWRKNTVC